MLLALAAFLTFSALRATAAPQSDDLPSDGYVMTHWGPNEGLPSADTWPIIQSREGYVWIGTGFGLVRFDGMKFTPFNSKDYPVFRAQQVTAIHEDKAGRIWVGLLSAGVLLYENGRFNPPAYCDAIANQSVTSIFSDSTGNVYLCTSAGVLMVRDGTASLVPDLPETPRIGFTASNGTVYVAGTALVRMRGPAGSQRTIVSGVGAPSHITDVVLEPSGTLFVVRQGEIHRYRLTQDSAVSAGGTINIPGALRLLRDGDRGYFLGTLGYGLVYFDGTTITHPQGLRVQRGAGRQIHAVMRDAEGGIWTTTSGGVYRFSRSFFTILGVEAGFTHDYAWLVHQQQDKTLWVGVGSDGMYRMKNGMISLLLKTDGMPDDHITEMFESADGRMWFGGESGALVTLDHGVFRHYEQLPGYLGGRVLSISEDERHRIWVGTRHGLHILEGNRFNVFTPGDGSPLTGVRNVVHTPNGDIWCISSATVHRIRNGTITTFTSPRGGAHFGTTSLMMDGDRVWFGTYGGGLFLIDRDSVVDLNRICRGFGPRIIDIREDRHGYLWINAERELQRVRKAELLEGDP